MYRFVSVYNCVRAINIRFYCWFCLCVIKQLHNKNYIHDNFFLFNENMSLLFQKHSSATFSFEIACFVEELGTSSCGFI